MRQGVPNASKMPVRIENGFDDQQSRFLNRRHTETVITTEAHAAALNWTRRALSEEPPDEEPRSIAMRAEMLTAIAAAEGVPIEVLIRWIHTHIPGKSWSGDEWRRFSAQYHSGQHTGMR
jgi:hypothetical protein